MTKIFLFSFIFQVLVVLVQAEDEKKEEVVTEAAVGSSRSAQALLETEKLVATLAAKVNAKEISISGLIKQKQTERDPEKVAEIIKLLQQEHRDWSALVQEYNSQLNVLKYRFPERGSTLKRKYKRFNPRTLDQLEQSVGIEKQLHISREKVKRVYGVEKETIKKPQDETNKKADDLLKPKTISK